MAFKNLKSTFHSDGVLSAKQIDQNLPRIIKHMQDEYGRMASKATDRVVTWGPECSFPSSGLDKLYEVYIT
jgi:hypothetical protein